MSYTAAPHIVGAANEYQLLNPPQDGISSLEFSPSGAADLLVSSWDSTVRLYDASSPSNNYVRAHYVHSAPVLDAAFIDQGRCVSGGLDCTLKVYDFVAQREHTLGSHEKAVRCLGFASGLGSIVSGSWDATLKMWDPRSQAPTATLNQPERVYAMDVTGHKAIVATAGRKVWIWDLRHTSGPEQRRDSSLKYQTRAVKAFPDGQGFVLSSIEGRVAVEYVEEAEQRRKYAFKCHRIKDGGVENVFPVNALAFHPQYGTFATGGSDALVNIWDPGNKKRLCQFHKYPTSISALAFSGDGSLLAMGSSYQYEFPADPNPIPKDAVFIRKLTDQETRPKS